MRHGGAQLVEVHMEAPVARHEYRLSARAHARADGRAHAEAHRAQAAARHEGARLLEFAVLRRPHLVLAYVRRHGRVCVRKAVQRG